jgi:17beta-estradiol 17-dehydrogenase / very-long-chain 3-oxoacyl-CoA reductase
MFWTLAYWIGLIKLLHFIYKAVMYVYKNKNKESFKSRYGEGWAIVTGATDGIGKEFCRDLAKKGVNIVLVSRNEEKLKKV